MRLSSLRNRPIIPTALALFGAAAFGAHCAQPQGSGTFNNGTGTGTATGSANNSSSTSGSFVPSFGGGDSGFTITGTGCGSGSCQDFPATPYLDMDGGTAPVSSSAPSSFGAPEAGASTGGPCLYEPPPGALIPNNWLRPRFYWSGGSGQALYELRLSSPKEAHDLVAYTTDTKWTMPKDVWTMLAADVQGSPINVTIRQMTAGGPVFGTSSSFVIAPAPAEGAMVFWATNSFATSATSTNLQGFQVGDESTTTVLKPTQVTQQVWAQPPDGGNFAYPPAIEPVGCVGCHTSTPDGDYVGFTAQWPWPNAIASVQADGGAVGAPPPWLTASAILNLSPNLGSTNYLGGANITATNNVDNVMLGIQTFSKAHYTTGDRIEIAQLGSSVDNPENSAGVAEGIQAACQGGSSPCVISQLAWINLEWNGNADAGRPTAAPGAVSNGGWGILDRGATDDARSAGTPNWSHDGTKIAYTSVDKGTQDGHVRTIPNTSPNGDIKIIPYTPLTPGPGGSGGTAAPVMGASDPTYNEFYPAFAPDDTLIAFNRVSVTDDMYNNPKDEVFVVSAGGSAQATRLAANDPAMCVGLTSPGVHNAWPKWAPAPAGGVITPAADGKIYYWVTFSSVRVSDTNNPASSGKAQLYIAGVVVDPKNGNAITTYPAIYLWNQDPTYNNLIPAWDNFAIPSAVGGPPR